MMNRKSNEKISFGEKKEYGFGEINQSDECISFEEMTEYVFGEIDQSDFLKIAARTNKHILKCPRCRKMYDSLMLLEEKLTECENLEAGTEMTTAKVFDTLLSEEDKKAEGVVRSSIDALIRESQNFKKCIYFNVKSLQELVEPNEAYMHPSLVTVMMSDTGDGSTVQTESTIQSSLIDRDKNRVSIGLDGTLSLYFDIKEHEVGKRVVILPDTPGKEDTPGTMMELKVYDDAISYVRFEGVTPGQYTVLVEQ